jgi:tetratricopeptide (TPR) repeat protein
MVTMKQVSIPGNKHHNKPVSSPARRSAAWLAAPIAIAALTFGAAFGLAGQAFAHRQSTHTSTASANRQLAQKDVQVGQFYMRIGKYDASISRFQGAAAHDPRWAVPHELLAEAFEKKDDLKHAIAEYREYLKIAPHAKDARKIKRRIEKLTRKAGEES